MGDALPAIGGAGGGLGYDYYQGLITHAIEQRGAYRLSPSPADLQVATTSPYNGGATHDIVASPPTADIETFHALDSPSAWEYAMMAASYVGANSMLGVAARMGSRIWTLQQDAPGFRYRHFGNSKAVDKYKGKRGAHNYLVYNLNKRNSSRKFYRSSKKKKF